MAAATCVQIIHKKPRDGGVSAVKSAGAVYLKHMPDSPAFAALRSYLQDQILPTLLRTLHVPRPPVLWTVDLIDSGGGAGETSAFGAADASRWVVGEVNCSCVGISELQSFASGAPAAQRPGVGEETLREGVAIAEAVGAAAVAAVLQSRKAPRAEDAAEDAAASACTPTHPPSSPAVGRENLSCYQAAHPATDAAVGSFIHWKARGLLAAMPPIWFCRARR